MPIICGPKCSICCTVLSGWGVIMLGLLGVFFYIRTPILAEDLPLSESEWALQNFSKSYMEKIYTQNAVNCWIAAALYVVTFIISAVMVKVNMKRGAM